MLFSFSFILNFALSFLGFLCLGIFLCRGTWRNRLRQPLALAVFLISLGHVLGLPFGIATMVYAVFIVVSLGYFIYAFRLPNFEPSVVREGHNAFSLLAGAALFALAVQLHAVVIGVPVFQLVK
jgi:hypothetical protein